MVMIRYERPRDGANPVVAAVGVAGVPLGSWEGRLLGERGNVVFVPAFLYQLRQQVIQASKTDASA
jgi:hypothetical protein